MHREFTGIERVVDCLTRRDMTFLSIFRCYKINILLNVASNTCGGAVVVVAFTKNEDVRLFIWSVLGLRILIYFDKYLMAFSETVEGELVK